MYYRLKRNSSPSLKLSTADVVREHSAKIIMEKKNYGAFVTRAASESSAIKPVAVILGWNDSKMKHLKKYSGLFESRGWSTVCLPTKSYNTFLRSDTKVKTISFYMIDLIKELAKNGNPVFLCSFSSGGCTVHFHIAEALTTHGHEHFNAFKVVGSVFDSCPATPNLESIPQIQKSVTDGIKNPVIKAATWYALGIAIPHVLKKPLVQRFSQDLGKMPLKNPELFLYSKGDMLVPYQDITKHIGNRESQLGQAGKVFSKCWEDSSHVSHYKKYPEQYTELLDKFIEVCLKENSHDFEEQ